MAIFSNFFFLGNKGQENVFYDIPEEKKTPFWAIKTASSKSRKIGIFPNWITHAFGPKIVIFFNFFSRGNIGKENVFYDILEQKKAFLRF